MKRPFLSTSSILLILYHFLYFALACCRGFRILYNYRETRGCHRISLSQSFQTTRTDVRRMPVVLKAQKRLQLVRSDLPRLKCCWECGNIPDSHARRRTQYLAFLLRSTSSAIFWSIQQKVRGFGVARSWVRSLHTPTTMLITKTSSRAWTVGRLETVYMHGRKKLRKLSARRGMTMETQSTIL